MEPKDLPLPRRAGQYMINLVLRAIMGLALALPYRWRVPAAGWLISRVVAPLAGYDRRVRENLTLAWPDLPEETVERLTRSVPDNAGRTLIEVYSGRQFARHLEKYPPQGPGWEAMIAAQAEGRPVILATAHFGNFYALRIAAAARFGKVGGLYRPLSNVFFNRHWESALSQNGDQPIFPKGRRGLAEMMKFVRGGNVMVILTDQHVSQGAPLRFFGRRAYTALSAFDIALKTNAIAVPCYGVRSDDGLGFRLIFEEPIPHSTPEEMAQAFNDSLEAQTRAHPGQWFWVHQRWKAIGADTDEDEPLV